MDRWFTKFASKASDITGSSWAFIVAAGVILLWGFSGPLFGFSDTWQLVINTSTTIITFLMVFLIQNTQNRDAKALHLKLDELIHTLGSAHNELLDVEDLTDSELNELTKVYRLLAAAKHGSADEEKLIKQALLSRHENPKDFKKHMGVPRGADEHEDGAELVVAGTSDVAPTAQSGKNRR